MICAQMMPTPPKQAPRMIESTEKDRALPLR